MRNVRSITVSNLRPVRRVVRRLRRLARTAHDSRGVAFIFATFVVFAVGMMLFAFVFLNQNEVGFAVFNRNSTQALGLAEAGVQEAAKRLAMFGGTPGSTQFTNSLSSGTVGSGTVTYQAAFQNNPQIFPILSVARFAGVSRGVRVLTRTTFKSGFGNALVAPSINVQSDVFTTTGETYSQGNINFQSNAPQCGSGASATNLVPPQVMTGTTILGQGASINSQCGSSAINGTYTYECASGSLTEVAPTPCPRSSDGSGNLLPYHMHVMVPIGMAFGDFNTVVTAGSLPPGISVVQATQNGVGVTYTSAGTYTPSYWTSVPSTNGKVMLIPATQPFCVRASPASVVLPAPAITGTCPAGYARYGNNVGGTANRTRFLDWGLVQDDLSLIRPVAQTFFQPPLCTAPCANPGNQNGIRYIPILPPINIIAEACVQHVNPGTNVFDQVNLGDGVSCTNPAVTTITSTTVTFTGTKSNPEALVIDNAGAATVSLTGSLPGMPSCTSSFDSYNWGMILASGNLSLPSNFAFSGFIYTQGSLNVQSGMSVQGGVFTPPANNALTNLQGDMNFCGGTSLKTSLFATFFNFTTMTWQDRPANKP